MFVLEHLQPPGRREISMNYRLPVELIWLILTELMNEFYLLAGANQRAPIALDIVHFSQVCRHWRHAALGFKEVWARILNIDVDSEFWTKALLYRSGNAPLTIHSKPESSRAPKGRFTSAKWGALFSQMHRAKEIDITISSHHDQFADTIPFFQTLYFTPAPILAVLHLAIGGIPVQIFQEEQAKTLLGGPNRLLFEGIAPNLRCLVLTCANLDPLLLMGLDLTHLKVTGLRALSTSVWLKFLDSQRNMEHLEFQVHQLSRGSSLSQPSLTQPHLPELQTLTLRVNNQESADLIGHLILPVSCDIHLNWEYVPDLSFMDPIGAVNAAFLGIQHRFQEWKNEGELDLADLAFFWEIELDDDHISVRVNTYGALTFSDEGSCLELSFEMGVDPHINWIASARILDMLRRSCGGEFGDYQSTVSIIANLEMHPRAHSSLIRSLKFLLSTLSDSVSLLLLSGDHAHHFIADFLHEQTSASFPVLSEIVFEGRFGQRDVNDALINYLRWRSQPNFDGMQVVVLNLLTLDSEGPEDENYPNVHDYQVEDAVHVNEEDMPSFEFDNRCSKCRF